MSLGLSCESEESLSLITVFKRVFSVFFPKRLSRDIVCYVSLNRVLVSLNEHRVCLSRHHRRLR